MPDSTQNSPNLPYALGHTAHEYGRLQRQARLLEPMTRRVFDNAGIEPGMRVVDLGAGVGDVSLLLAELVGPPGHVTGIERDAGALAVARKRVAQAGLTSTICMVEASVDEFTPAGDEAPFDAMVGRLVLMYQRDPAATLRRYAEFLRPGGVIAFMEPWLSPPAAVHNPAQRVFACVVETMFRSGVQIDLGPRLHKVFPAAGLPIPAMHFEAVMDGHEDSPLYPLSADLYLSARPRAIELGVAIVEGVADEDLPTLLRDTMNRGGYAPAMLATVAAWTRKPG